VQPAVGDPASAGGVDWVTHRGPFQPLLFCDSVILRRSFFSQGWVLLRPTGPCHTANVVTPRTGSGQGAQPLPASRDEMASAFPHFADFSPPSAHVLGLPRGEPASLHLGASSSLQSCNEGDAGTHRARLHPGKGGGVVFTPPGLGLNQGDQVLSADGGF